MSKDMRDPMRANMGFAANMFLVKEGDSTISKTYDIIIYWMLLGTDGYSIYPE